MNNLEKKILEYGRKREIPNLHNLIFETDQDELAKLVEDRMNSTNFECLWDYLLKSFQDSAKCHKTRINLILAFLQKLEDHEVLSSHQSCSLVQRICMDLMKFKTKHLIDLSNFCLKSIQSNKISSHLSCSWKDLLPNTLRILSERDVVEFNELEYTGQEFKTNFINILCMSNWSPSIITSLTAMFIDMPLTKEERLKVVNKLSSYIEKLTPQEVPPFVYHLLRLCQHQNSRAVFLKLQNYFGLRIYSKTRNDSGSGTPDLDCIEDAENHDVIEAESTVLFHIHNAASIGHNCIKDYITSLKNTTKSPEFILHPFQLLTLFTISTVQQYEETVFDIIRHSVVRSYNEQHKRMSSRWYREMINSSIKPEDVFKQIMNSGNREFLLEALVNFGFTLLGVGSALGRDIIAEKQWSLGTLILLKVIKQKKHVASIILKTFCNHIITRQSAIQYIECLFILCRSSPLLMLENQSCVVELIESLVQINGNVANQLLDALILLTKVSPNIRDQLILILRKALYSRSIETRQMAVNGFVKLITTLRLVGGGVLSQSTGSFVSSGYSLYTQISLNRTTQTVATSTFSNEAICWEVLGILKRCFMQQAEVRSKLYEDLFDAICINSELGIPVLDIFWFHFVEYYVMDEESNPPLNFNKVADLRETDSILLEPLGKFIFTIAQIVAQVLKSEDDRDNPTVVKYVEILDSLCNRMANCELVHFELDDGTDLTDILPESQQKVHILKEIINVFEALIGYKIATLDSKNDNQCRVINSLYQGYSRFLHFGKNLAKPKKAKKNEKLSQKDENKQSQKTAPKETQANTTRKVDQAAKTQSRSFKAPDTLLDLATVEKGLGTLLEPSVPWATTNDANTIKTKTEIHRHFINAAIYLVGKNKNLKTVDSQYQRSCYEHITTIAATLYNRIIKRLSDYVDFDCMSAVSSIECFHAILLLINGQFKNNLINFLSKLGGKDKESTLVEHLQPIVKEFQKLFETEEDELSNDPEIKKLSLMVINVLNVLCGFIPDNSNVLSVEVYEWLKQYSFNNTVPSRVAGTLMSLLFETHVKYQEGLGLFERVSAKLMDVIGVVDEEIDNEESDDLKIIDLSTSNAILQTLCSHVKNILDDIDSILARIKSEYYILTYQGEGDVNKRKNDLKTKEKGISCQLCFVVEILANLANTAVPLGNISDAVFKNIMQLYSSLSSLTKYFMGRSSKNNLAFQGVWFERLVKKAGKKLASLVYKLILHLDGYHNQEDATQGRKKAVEGSTMKNKVLRETKIIPKVIYEIEQFSKTIIQLTKKTKFDLSKYVGQGTSRDFRIKQPALQELLQQEGEDPNVTRSTQDDAEESREETRSDVESNDGTEINDENEDPTSPPPTKKSKR